CPKIQRSSRKNNGQSCNIPYKLRARVTYRRAWSALPASATGAAGRNEGQSQLILCACVRRTMTELDDIDRKLLALLQTDDRLALAELSKKIGVAASTLNDRIKRLVRNGVITGFHARVSSDAIGLDLLAFMLIGWSDPKVEPVFLDRIRKSPAVLECHH